jgi:hypothetical protein
MYKKSIIASHNYASDIILNYNKHLGKPKKNMDARNLRKGSKILKRKLFKNPTNAEK